MRTFILRISAILFVGAFLYFIDVSGRRFNAEEDTAKRYYLRIPSEAPIQNPEVYSYLDYTSQWYYNGLEIISMYEFDGFNGQITFQSVLTILNRLGVINYNAEEYMELREKKWPQHYSYSFNGFSAYAIYDYGIVGSLLFTVIYSMVVNYLRPKAGKIRLQNLFLISLLIQVPLMAIFYSQMGGIIIALILSIPIFVYSNFTFKAK